MDAPGCPGTTQRTSSEGFDPTPTAASVWKYNTEIGWYPFSKSKTASMGVTSGKTPGPIRLALPMKIRHSPVKRHVMRYSLFTGSLLGAYTNPEYRAAKFSTGTLGVLVEGAGPPLRAGSTPNRVAAGVPRVAKSGNVAPVYGQNSAFNPKSEVGPQHKVLRQRSGTVQEMSLAFGSSVEPVAQANPTVAALVHVASQQ